MYNLLGLSYSIFMYIYVLPLNDDHGDDDHGDDEHGYNGVMMMCSPCNLDRLAARTASARERARRR